MHPRLALGPVEVAAYTLFQLLGAVAAAGITLTLAHRRGLDVRRVLPAVLAAIAGVWVGARLLHVAVDRRTYLEEPSRLFAVRFTGFALYGGLLGGGALGAVVARRRGLPLWRLADVAAVGAGVGIAVLRVGCFLNGCCFGEETRVPWGVSFPAGSPAWAHQTATGDVVGTLFGTAAGDVRPVHPTQLYELVAALAVAALAWGLGRRAVADGVPFLVAGSLFTLFRFVNWQLRVPAGSFDAPAWFYGALYPGIAAVLVSLLVLRRRSCVSAARG